MKLKADMSQLAAPLNDIASGVNNFFDEWLSVRFLINRTSLIRNNKNVYVVSQDSQVVLNVPSRWAVTSSRKCPFNSNWYDPKFMLLNRESHWPIWNLKAQRRQQLERYTNFGAKCDSGQISYQHRYNLYRISFLWCIFNLLVIIN